MANRINNEINRQQHQRETQPIGSGRVSHKLASLLAVIVTFQEKIEILRVKLCGHPGFSPELYYKQIDRCEKGYIDTQDFVTFVKKAKPNFNMDHRYLKSLFAKLNQDERVPKDRLTYFGYLNIIKPYFDSQLAKDLLMRDSVSMGSEINMITKKLLEDLICTLYVCVAEHEKVKQLIILGDIEQGGSDPGDLYNIYEILKIIKREGQSPLPNTATNLPSSASIQDHPTSSNPNMQSQRSILASSRPSKDGTLDLFYNFIARNSEYEIERDDMRYLLAYLMCHEFMLVQDKYLTQLFMPVCASVELPTQKGTQGFQKTVSNIGTEMNFLSYVHPNSLSNSTLQNRRKRAKYMAESNQEPLKQSQNPEIRINKPKGTERPMQSQLLIEEQPRTLLKAPQNSLQTPILQRFMKESRVLKNMSRYRQEPILEESSHHESAFISESKYRSPANNLLNPNQIAAEHRQRPANKDFNLQEVLNNSNLHKSEYYQNLSMRAQMKGQPLQPSQMVSPQRNQSVLDGSGILNDFMLK